MPQWSMQPARYPNAYVWFIFVSAMDTLLTWLILHLGGFEANLLADAILRRFGLSGLVAFKFSLVVMVVLICEAVGRRNDVTGRRLAAWAAALSAIPVVVAFAQLLVRQTHP